MIIEKKTEQEQSALSSAVYADYLDQLDPQKTEYAWGWPLSCMQIKKSGLENILEHDRY